MAAFTIFWCVVLAIFFFVLSVFFKALASSITALQFALEKTWAKGALPLVAGTIFFLLYFIISRPWVVIAKIIALIIAIIVLFFVLVIVTYFVESIFADSILVDAISSIQRGFVKLADMCERMYIRLIKVIKNRLVR